MEQFYVARDIKKIEDLLQIREYRYGVAEIEIGTDKLKQVTTLISFKSKTNVPEDKILSFLEKYNGRAAKIRIRVIEPARKDCRVSITGIVLPSYNAKIKTNSDMIFWKDFMALGKESNARLIDENDKIGWEWD